MTLLKVNLEQYLQRIIRGLAASGNFPLGQEGTRKVGLGCLKSGQALWEWHCHALAVFIWRLGVYGGSPGSMAEEEGTSPGFKTECGNMQPQKNFSLVSSNRCQ